MQVCQPLFSLTKLNLWDFGVFFLLFRIKNRNSVVSIWGIISCLTRFDSVVVLVSLKDWCGAVLSGVADASSTSCLEVFVAFGYSDMQSTPGKIDVDVKEMFSSIIFVDKSVATPVSAAISTACERIRGFMSIHPSIHPLNTLNSAHKSTFHLFIFEKYLHDWVSHIYHSFAWK